MENNNVFKNLESQLSNPSDYTKFLSAGQMISAAFARGIISQEQKDYLVSLYQTGNITALETRTQDKLAKSKPAIEKSLKDCYYAHTALMSALESNRDNLAQLKNMVIRCRELGNKYGTKWCIPGTKTFVPESMKREFVTDEGETIDLIELHKTIKEDIKLALLAFPEANDLSNAVDSTEG